MTMDEYYQTFGPEGLPAFHPDPLVIIANDRDNDDSNNDNDNNDDDDSNHNNNKNKNNNHYHCRHRDRGCADRNDRLRQRTSKDMIETNFPKNFTVTLSSSNSFSQHRRTVPLSLYLEEMSRNNGTTNPDQLSNETWYLFGETYTDPWKQFLLLQEPTNMTNNDNNTNSSSSSNNVSSSSNNGCGYQLPPCQTCQHQYSALSFGIGNKGSGVQWHQHGPGFSEVLHGRKHWLLYPPQYTPPFFFPTYQSTQQWMEVVYTNTTLLTESLQSFATTTEMTTKNNNNNKNDDNDGKSPYPILENGKPYECTLQPGDLLYFPDRFYHATINCDPYTVFVSTFTSDHLYMQDQKKKQQQQQGLQQQLQGQYVNSEKVMFRAEL